MMDASEERTLHIQLLGDFRLAYGDELVTSVDAPRLQSLVAYLLLHRDTPQSRHRLAFVFWPDSSEGQALTNLRNLLFRLRQDLPDADRFLQVSRKTLQWRVASPYDLDVARFEEALDRADRALESPGGDEAARRMALEQAIDAYGGDLVPSCYDDWIDAERQRLRQALQEALKQLIDLLESQREYRAAIRMAQRLVRHDPLREVSYRRLMRLRALTGDRAGALRTYHRCATVLEREFDVGPSPAMREMYERLLVIDETIAPASARPRRMLSASPLVGRHEAWSQLREVWRKVAEGRTHLATISGEAGIGKTRLAEELVQWANRQGITTAAARCYAGEGELAYAPVAAWLRQLPLPSLERVWLSEVARIVPELLSQKPELSQPGPLTESWQRRRFFEALARATLGATQPMVLLIDALQWCDRGTLEWLHYLLRYDPSAQMLVVGTFRPGESKGDDPQTTLLHALRQDGQTTDIRLSSLDKAETATLAANVAGRDLERNLIDCLFRETEGNPLFIVETVRAGLPDEVRESPSGGFVCMPRPLPSRMKDALLARLDQLSPSARALAELASTIGREFTFDVLREATDAGEDVLVRGLDELWQHRIVREQGEDAYDFSHDKLREVICAELSEARRRMLHRHVAWALERIHSDNVDLVAARVALHYEHAGETEEAVEYYRRAAKMALTMQATEEAARYRQRASALRKESAVGDP